LFTEGKATPHPGFVAEFIQADYFLKRRRKMRRGRKAAKKMHKKINHHHKKHLSFLEAMRLYAGMPI